LEDATLESRQLASLIVDTIADHLGEDIVLLDISDVSILADFFVIATAGSDRQLRTLAEEVRKTANAGGRRVRVEGDVQSGWVLVDHGDVITHLFSSEKRQLYRLEDAWSQARVVVRVQ